MTDRQPGGLRGQRLPTVGVAREAKLNGELGAVEETPKGLEEAAVVLVRPQLGREEEVRGRPRETLDAHRRWAGGSTGDDDDPRVRGIGALDDRAPRELRGH